MCHSFKLTVRRPPSGSPLIHRSEDVHMFSLKRRVHIVQDQCHDNDHPERLKQDVISYYDLQTYVITNKEDIIKMVMLVLMVMMMKIIMVMIITRARMTMIKLMVSVQIVMKIIMVVMTVTKV